MPDFCCLCTSHPFSARSRAGACFCHGPGVSVYCYSAQPPRSLLVSCCLWMDLQFPSFPSCQTSCVGQRSAPLPSLLLSWKASSTRCANAQLGPGHLRCSLHTFRHNIYTGPLRAAGVQINDRTVCLLGFCRFWVLQLCPASWRGHVMGPSAGSRHHAGLAPRPTTRLEQVSSFPVLLRGKAGTKPLEKKPGARWSKRLWWARGTDPLRSPRQSPGLVLSQELSNS